MIKPVYRFLSGKFQNVFLDYKVDFKPRFGHGKPPHTGLYSIINDNRADYKNTLNSFLQYKKCFSRYKISRQRN